MMEYTKLVGGAGESARADIGRRDIAQRVPKLLRSLDSILHGRACGAPPPTSTLALCVNAAVAASTIPCSWVAI